MKLLIGALALTLALTACDDDSKAKVIRIEQPIGGGGNSGGSSGVSGSSGSGGGSSAMIEVGEKGSITSNADNHRIQGSFASVTYIGKDLSDESLDATGNMLNIYSIVGDDMVLAELDLQQKVYMISTYKIGLDGDVAEVIPQKHSCENYKASYKNMIGRVNKTQLIVGTNKLLVSNEANQTELMKKISDDEMDIIQNKVRREFELLNNKNCKKEAKTSKHNADMQQIEFVIRDFIAN